MTNYGQVQANEPDPNGGNDTDSETTDVVRRTDLAIDKRDDGSDAVAGTNYTYTLEVTNLGPSDSSGATVTDTLPADWQFVASSNASCGGNGADPETVTCTVGPFVSGAATSFTITVAVPSNAVPGTVTNTAHVQANETDPNGGNDTDSEETDVVARADLRLDKTDSPDPVMAGETLHLHADGDQQWSRDVQQVVIEDTLPTGVTPSGVQTCSWPVIPVGESRPMPDRRPSQHRHAGNHSEYCQRSAPVRSIRIQRTTPTRKRRRSFTEREISGYVWNDLNGDGVWDADEPGLNGWTVYLDLNDDGLLQSDEPWLVTQYDGQHDGAFRFANLPPGNYAVREWVPDAWRQTFPAGGDGAHRVTPPIQGGFGQTAAPNFGNNSIQVIQFITPLSVLRHDAALADRRFIRPADDPLTAWQGLNPSLPLQDYLDAFAPWQSFPVQNSSAATLRYTVTFERHVQSPGDAFLVITDEQLNPLVGDTITIDIPAGQTRRFFVFYDQPEMTPGDQVLRTYPDWYNQPETAGNEALTPAHTFARDDHLLVVTEVRDLLGTVLGGIELVCSPGRSLDFRQRHHLRWLRLHGRCPAIWPARSIFADCARRPSVGSHVRYQCTIRQRGRDDARNRLRRLRPAECRIHTRTQPVPRFGRPPGCDRRGLRHAVPGRRRSGSCG